MQEDSATHLYESNSDGLHALTLIQLVMLRVWQENKDKHTVWQNGKFSGPLNDQGQLVLPLGTLGRLREAERLLQAHLGPAVLEAAKAIDEQQSKQRQTLDGVCDLILSKND
jgi:hypothetical protein